MSGDMSSISGDNCGARGRCDSPWSPWRSRSPSLVIGLRARAARHREESEPTACERPMIGERALLASPRFTGTAGPITAGDAPRPEGQGALGLPLDEFRIAGDCKPIHIDAG